MRLFIRLSILLWTILTFAACTSLAGANDGGLQKSPAGKVWLVLDQAYSNRDAQIIKKYRHAKRPSVRLLADAVYYLGSHNARKLYETGRRCMSGQVLDSADSVNYYSCLMAVISGTQFMSGFKSKAEWLARTKKFYNRNKQKIDEIAPEWYTSWVRGSSARPLTQIEGWPDEHIHNHGQLGRIELDDGKLLARIGRQKVPMLVDTGSTGIELSLKDIKKFHLRKYIVDLNYAVRGIDNTSGFSGKEYIIKRISFGPLVIENAYVTISRATTAVGINILKHLGGFKLSKSAIMKVDPSSERLCGPMNYIRSPLGVTVTYPLVMVKFNNVPMGFYFDSGSKSRMYLKNIRFTVPIDMASTLAKANRLSNVRIHRGVMEQNGKTIKYPLVSFTADIDGTRMRGFVGDLSLVPVDPLFKGSFNRNILDVFSVVYAFKKHEMCLAKARSG